MTKKHFVAMAAIVSNVRTGEWTTDAPYWARSYIKAHGDTDRTRTACHIAEAFIVLALANNPRFDESRFLQACGIVPKPLTY